jgi:hypothetical protein
MDRGPESKMNSRRSGGTACNMNGGADENRTHDLCIANATLSQLSYRPVIAVSVMKNAEQCQYFAGSYRPMSSFGKAGFSFSEYDGAAIRPPPSAVPRKNLVFMLKSIPPVRQRRILIGHPESLIEKEAHEALLLSRRLFDGNAYCCPRSRP